MTPVEAVVSRTEKMRNAMGMSMERFSKACDLPYSTVRELLIGKSKDVNFTTLIKLANGLDLSLREFFDSDYFDMIDDEYY